MNEFKANTLDYNILEINNYKSDIEIRPYFRDDEGNERMWRVSPQHGRSYVVDKRDGRYIRVFRHFA